ncbi:MAG TPA: TrbI/VirB10 family protein [Longimicrobium sp.]|jgi:type IV secretion system protein VirB10
MTDPTGAADPAFVGSEDSANLRRAVTAADAAPTPGPATQPPASAPEAEPVEEGPRRTLLVVLAAVAGAILLWMLFRSVPEERAASSQQDRESAGAASAVEGMANEADPSWMQAADTARRIAGAPGTVVPPVYGPAGSGARGYDQAGVQPDSGATADSTAVARGETAAAPAENPRREAFLAALRSKPLQGGASFAPDRGQAAEAGGEDELPEPPTLAEMEAAAQAEAERRSVPPAASGGFSVGGGPPAAATPPFVDYGSAPAGRSSRSSYVTGGSGGGPRAAAPQQLAPRGAAAGSVVVPVGTIIEGQLHTRVNSDLPGSVVGMVTRNVYDATQRVVVIPRYSWLFGTYESDVATGQARLVVQWTAIRFPNGDTYELPALRAGERTGASGLPGRVNNHYGRIFGQALLSSVIAAGFDLGRSDRGEDERRSARDVLADATAQQLGQTAAEVTRRNLDIKPTWTSRGQVTPFSIILDRDLVFTQPSRR